MDGKKYLVIPIEIKSRELDGSLYLALEALKKGWDVILGQKQVIWSVMEGLPPSIFFYKSAVPGEEKNIMKIKDHNHKLTVLDIEGLVLAPEPIGAKRRYSNKNISKLDHIFFWGREDYNRAIKIFPKLKKKSSILGSHIVDTWKIFKKKNNLKKNRKQIMISTNFARSDKKLKNARYELEKLMFKKISKKQDKLLKAEYELKEKGYENFLKMIKNISKKLPNKKFIIRPHPEENLSNYKTLLDLKNVKIDNKTDRKKQLITSSFLIHFNSTMSVEARFLEKKVLMYYPVRDKELMKVVCPTPKKISNSCFSMTDLQKNINRNIKQRNLNSFLKNWKDVNYRSSKEIVKVFDKINEKLNRDKNTDFNMLRMFFNFLKFKLKNNLFIIFGYLSFLLPFLKGKYRRGIYRTIIGQGKWIGLNENEIRQKILYLNDDKKFNTKKIKINKYFNNMFKISTSD